MNANDVLILQSTLNDLGYGPLILDGVYGHATQRAHEQYLVAHIESPELAVTLPAAKPWWTSRAVLGSLVTIAASAAGLAGYAFDAGGLTDVLVSITTALAGLLAYVGTVQRSAAIDPTLVAPGVRRDGFRLRRIGVSPGALDAAEKPALDDDILNGPFFDNDR
jgi:peptidoglycan hydrolase-like protein with peptidoglycan-binding domain